MEENKRKERELVNCLRKERVTVRYLPKQTGMITNPRHTLYGGMSENSIRRFTVPRLTSGMFVNVLTDSEKDYLEDAMGLEYNALSIYKKENNFWDDSNDFGISSVTLRKQDNYLDLSNPEDYIRYKILLANKNFIAPSLKALEDYPRATYQFVIVSEDEESKKQASTMTTTMKCYKEFGKYEDDRETLKTIIELITGRPLAKNVKIEYLQTKANELIQSNNKLFLRTITDPMLSTKTLIRRAVLEGVIAKRGDYYYLREDNSPLCDGNEDPTLNVAAEYLNRPKKQDLLLSIQAKLK